MTLILKLDLDIVRMYLHTKNEVSMSSSSKVIQVDFLRKDDTDYIMENKSQLPGGVYADREYNQETERKRKLLRPILKAARQHRLSREMQNGPRHPGTSR